MMVNGWRLGILATGSALVVAACMHDPSGTEGPTTTAAGTGGSTSTGSTAGAGGTPSGSATGGAATGTPAGTSAGTGTGTGSGGAGGGVVTSGLVDTGLVTRYYLDESASGQGNATVADAAPNPLDLQMTWGTELNYAEDADGNRGLRWTEIEQYSRASAAVAGTKVIGMHGSLTGTIEVVVEVSAVSSDASRLSHIGSGSESGSFTLSMQSTTRLNFYKYNPSDDHSSLRGRWAFDAVGRGRTVIHLVYDSTQADELDRAKLYLDGARQPWLEGWPAPQDEPIAINVDEHYALGNRQIGERTFIGTLYYAAMYSAALTEAEVLQNTGVLIVDDDDPAGSP